MKRTVFVTVGTTKFDELIQTVTEIKILKIFKKLGYSRLILQIGNGTFIPSSSNIINLEYYQLKPSIKEDIKNADLIISHAGAGSCLEILGENKKLIAVINEKLMGNHQKELATALAKRRYIKCCTCKSLEMTLLENFENIIPYPQGDTIRFANYLNKCVGFSNK